MGSSAVLFNSAFRDHVIEGNANSGAHKPVKSEIRAAAADVDARLLALEAYDPPSSATLAVPGDYATLQAALDALKTRFLGEIVTISITGKHSVAGAQIGLVEAAFGERVKIRGARDPLTKSIASSGHSVVSTAFAAARVARGSGYTPGTHAGTVVGGTGTAAVLSVVVDAAGLVASATVLSAGSYTIEPDGPVTVTGLPAGSGATFNLSYERTCVLKLTSVADVAVDDVVLVDAPKNDDNQFFWACDSLAGTMIGFFSTSGANLTLTEQLHDLLTTDYLVFANGESREVITRNSATSFVLSSGFTTTLPDTEPDPENAATNSRFAYGFFIKKATGTVSTSGRSTTLTGSGTSFTSYSVGDVICADGILVRIVAIASDTSLTMEVAQTFSAGTKFGVHAMCRAWEGAFRVTAIDGANNTVTFKNRNSGNRLKITPRQLKGGSVTILRDCLIKTDADGAGLALAASLAGLERIGLIGPGSGSAILTAQSGDYPYALRITGATVGLCDWASGLVNWRGDVYAPGLVMGNITVGYGILNHAGRMWAYAAKISTAAVFGYFGGVGSSNYFSYLDVVGGRGAAIFLISGAGYYADGARMICPDSAGLYTRSGANGHAAEIWSWCAGGNAAAFNQSKYRLAGARLFCSGANAFISSQSDGEANGGFASGSVGSGWNFNGGHHALVQAIATGNGATGFLGGGRDTTDLRRAISRRNGSRGFYAIDGSQMKASESYALNNVTADYAQADTRSYLDKSSAISGSSTTAGPVGQFGGSGTLALDDGTVSAPSVSFASDPNTGLYSNGADVLGLAVGGEQQMLASAALVTWGPASGSGAGYQVTIRGEAGTGIELNRYSADASGPLFGRRKARGTIASPAAVANGDVVARDEGYAHNSSAFTTVWRQNLSMIETTPGTGAMGARWTMSLTPVGSVTLTEIARLDHSTGLSLFGANPVIDQDRLHRQRVYTVAGLPAAGTAGRTAFASNGRKNGEGGGAGTGVLVFDDGTAWRACDTGATVAA